MDNFTGVIIEESLENSNVLRKLKVMKKDVEKVTERHRTPWLKKWTKYTVEIPEDKMSSLAIEISRYMGPNHAWYTDFKNSKFHYIIFFNKVYKIDLSRKEEYAAAIRYGLHLGIPDYQLNWETL